MGLEIERKFLICNNSWRTEATGIAYRQGYLCATAGCCVRVRTTGQQNAWLTIKKHVDAAVRLEYEYPLPILDAIEMLERLCGGHLVEKVRYKVPHSGLIWEIDEFAGENAGLLIAEVELTRQDQQIVLPDWVGTEVTDNMRYYNACLATHPYSSWKS